MNHDLYIKLRWSATFFGESNAIEEISADEVIKNTIIYDSDNFPVKVIGVIQKTGRLKVEYSYEYINI